MSIESKNPFLNPPATSPSHPRRLARTLLGPAGKELAKRLQQRPTRIANSLPPSPEPPLQLTEQESRLQEQHDRVRRLLSLGQEFMKSLDGRSLEEEVDTCLYFANAKRRLGEPVDDIEHHLSEMVDSLEGESFSMIHQHVFLSLLQDPYVPRWLIDHVVAAYRSMGLSERILPVFESALCCRDARDGVAGTRESVEDLSEAMLWSDDSRVFDLDTWLRLVRARTLCGLSAEGYMSEAEHVVSVDGDRAEEGRNRDKIGMGYIELKQNEKALEYVKSCQSKSYDGYAVFLKILEDKTVSQEMRQRVYQLVCERIVQRERWKQQASEGVHDSEDDYDWEEDYYFRVGAIEDLRDRLLFMPFELEFGFSGFPEFPSWIEEVLRKVVPMQLPEAYILVAQTQVLRGEDATHSLQEAWRSAYMQKDELGGFLLVKDVLCADVRFGQDLTEWKARFMEAWERVLSWGRYELSAGVARAWVERDPGQVEEYVRLAQRTMEGWDENKSGSLSKRIGDLVRIVADAAIKISDIVRVESRDGSHTWRAHSS